MSIIKEEPLSEYTVGDDCVKQEFVGISPNEHEITQTSVLKNSADKITELQIDEECVKIPKIESVETLKDPLSLSDDDINQTGKNNELQKQPKKKRERVKTKQPLVSCSKCDTNFKTYASFERHMRQVHKITHPHDCRICGKAFKLRENRTKHEETHQLNRAQGEPKFPCDICGQKFHLSGTMRSHKIRVHFGYKSPSRLIAGSFKCTICPQTLTTNASLKKHIRAFHEHSTSSGNTNHRRKFEQGQPCPCKFCGKIFPYPSLLADHITIHTGEMPFSCQICHKKFRLRCSLRRHTKSNHLKDKLFQNNLKLFKCRVCGKDDFVYLGALRRHCELSHGGNLFETEQMKPFACGICGKPHHTREGALICAILGHDPTRFRKEMFKFRCPECPDEEILGFYNMSLLRKHWYDKHSDKKLPGKFLAGVVPKKSENVTPPRFIIDRKRRIEIETNGPPNIKYEYPLYTELDMITISGEQKKVFKKRSNHKGQNCKVVRKNNSRYGTFTCTICGLKTCRKDALNRHIQVVHESGKYQMQEHKLLKSNGKNSNVGTVIVNVDSGVIVKQEIEEYEEYSKESIPKSTNEKIFNCRFCERKWTSARALRMHEVKKHLSLRRKSMNCKCSRISPERKMKNKRRYNKKEKLCGSVNVNDKAAVCAILNFQSVQVQLPRI